jgi:hypothetical protein
MFSQLPFVFEHYIASSAVKRLSMLSIQMFPAIYQSGVPSTFIGGAYLSRYILYQPGPAQAFEDFCVCGSRL